jgi:hypothetical protein
MYKTFTCFLLLPVLLNCQQRKNNKPAVKQLAPVQTPIKYNGADIKMIHVFVALCDNKYQGIVPVPAGIGNGQDAASNLYWGCGYGVKGFFTRQKNWQLLSTKRFDTGSLILERLVFKYRTKNIYLVADAYDGKAIKTCTINFLKSCSGNYSDSVQVNNKDIYCGGASQIVAYIGHDGLMDFSLSDKYIAIDNKKREAMIFACISKKYFAAHLQNTGATPVVWTSGLCSPEAYSLSAALESRINEDPIQNAATKAAAAYHQYQKCGLKAAQKLMIYN